jgi:hypothetical protein
VTWKLGILPLEDDCVRFLDDSLEPIDVIVWCTGSKVSFPFFDEPFARAVS